MDLLTQNALALATVGLAVVYLARRWFRFWKGAARSAGGCGGGCSPSSSPKALKQLVQLEPVSRTKSGLRASGTSPSP